MLIGKLKAPVKNRDRLNIIKAAKASGHQGSYLELFENLLLKHSNQGDVVLDTFMGSATTAFACINTQRRYVGSELDEKYYQLSSD